MMDKQKFVLEMAKDICRVKLNCNDVCNPISACDALKYAERAVEAGYCKPEWISVDERLPEPNKLVLCIWERKDDGWHYGFARYQRENVWYVSNEGMPRVTHWMPLPEAPKMKGGAE